MFNKSKIVNLVKTFDLKLLFVYVLRISIIAAYAKLDNTNAKNKVKLKLNKVKSTGEEHF